MITPKVQTRTAESRRGAKSRHKVNANSERGRYMPTDRITDAHNKGQADSARDNSRRTNFVQDCFDEVFGKPCHQAPMAPDTRKAYEEGWQNAKK